MTGLDKTLGPREAIAERPIKRPPRSNLGRFGRGHATPPLFIVPPYPPPNGYLQGPVGGEGSGQRAVFEGRALVSGVDGMVSTHTPLEAR